MKPPRASSPGAQSITQDAIGLLTEEGYGEFTPRKAASRDGIKLALRRALRMTWGQCGSLTLTLCGTFRRCTSPVYPALSGRC
jgi:hypothetical protein